jgi:hypothetical protein
MCKMNNLSRRLFALPLETVIALVLCLGGFSAHYLADNFEHFKWESTVDTAGPELDHGDHQDEIALCTPSRPAITRAGAVRLLWYDCLYLFSPSLSPLLPPPKTLATA